MHSCAPGCLADLCTIACNAACGRFGAPCGRCSDWSTARTSPCVASLGSHRVFVDIDILVEPIKGTKSVRIAFLMAGAVSVMARGRTAAQLLLARMNFCACLLLRLPTTMLA